MKEDEKKFRYFLKDSIRKEVDFASTDQNLGMEAPPIQKKTQESKERISLPKANDLRAIGSIDVFRAIENRKSRRRYADNAVNLEELSFLLWATQGVRKDLKSTVFRNVPSAGNRHAFETYLCVLDVEDLKPGVYRYLPIGHELVLEYEDDRDSLKKKIVNATLGQNFTASSSVVFLWSVIPYRGEWRYGIAAHKVIAIDAGHVCQNLYIACEAIGAGTCAIAAYDQQLSDKLTGVDGKDEFVIYLASVGKV